MEADPKGPMTPTPIQAVIFDVGNVQVAFDPERMLRQLAQVMGCPVAAVRELLYGRPGLLLAYEGGALDSTQFLARLEALAGHGLDARTIISAYTEIFTPIPTTEALIRRLKPRYRLGLLSNTSPWHVTHYIQRMPTFELFDAVTLSCVVGANKPDPSLYQDALHQLALPPQACVYIDDIPAYAQAASALGMRGLTYTTAEQLETDLRALGVEA